MEEMSRKKIDIGRIFVCIAWCIFFAARFWWSEADAQEREESCESQTLVFTATFSLQTEDEGEITLRAGRDLVLRLEVTAREEEFCGYVNVLMQNEQEKHVLYQQRVERILPGESFSCQVLLPMNLKTVGLYLTLTDEKGEVKLERTIPIETVNYGFYAMVAVFDAQQETAQGNVYGHFSSYGSRLVEVSEPELACGARAMDALEVIVTQEPVLVALEKRAAAGGQEAERAAESLKEWVIGGKTLVVGADPETDAPEEMLNFGLQEKELFQEVVLRVGNYEATREGVLETNEEVKKQHGSSARTIYIGDSMLGGASVSSLSDEAVGLPIVRLKEGEHWWDSDASYEVLWQERGRDILRCYHVGKGNVLVFAVPVTRRPTGVYPLFYYRMAGMVIDNLAQSQIQHQSMEMYGSSAGNQNYLLTYIPAKSIGISVFPYAVILMVYILVFIPAAFLVLRRLGRTKYLWGVLPVLSFAVMGVVYLTGRHTRITEPYCTYLEITDYTEGKQSVNFSLSSPSNGETEILLKEGVRVRLAEAAFCTYDPAWMYDYVPQENALAAREYRAAVRALPGETRLGVDAMRAFAKTSFYAWTDVPGEGGEISAVVASADRVVTGAIRNTTDQVFREVYVCSKDFAVRVGSMQPGEELLLEDCFQKVLEKDADGWYSGDVYWLLFDIVQGRDYTEANILNALFLDHLEENGELVYIFALPKEEGSEILGAAAQNPGSTGLSVLIWAAQDQR